MAFAELEDLKGRLEWTLDSDEERIAQGALDDLSADACFYGNPRWTETTVPSYVKTMVLKAAQRYMRNPDGYEQSRAGDETVGWGQSSDDEKGSAYFSKKEIDALRSLVRPRVFGSVNVQAYGTKLRRPGGTVPDGDNGTPIRMFASESDPW